VTRLWVQQTGGWFPASKRNFPLVHAVKMCSGAHPEDEGGQSVTLPTHLRLVPGLKMTGARTPNIPHLHDGHTDKFTLSSTGYICSLYGSLRAFNFTPPLSYNIKKIKQSHYRTGQALRARQSAHEGGKGVSPTHRSPLTPGNIPGTRFCQRLSRPQGHSAAGRIMLIKNSNHTIGNRTHDLLVCSALPQPTAPPRAPSYYIPSF
jgi:hypothetical protein